MNTANPSGSRFAGNFRTDEPAPLVITGLTKGEFAAARIVHSSAGHGISEIPAQDALVFSYLMSEFTDSDLWVGGRPTKWQPARAGQVHFYSLERGIKADIKGPLDFVYLYLPFQVLHNFADEHELPRFCGCSLNSGTAFEEPWVAEIARSLLPALEQPKQADQLFVDQLAHSLQSNFARRYARILGRPILWRGGLSPWQERRAKEMIRANIDGELTVGQLARDCGLSRSQFFRAFGFTTGKTPHQWLIQYRVELAKGFLASPAMSLSEIAAACGFSSPSHFSRTFLAHVGATPGGWRSNFLK